MPGRYLQPQRGPLPQRDGTPKHGPLVMLLGSISEGFSVVYYFLLSCFLTQKCVGSWKSNSWWTSTTKCQTYFPCIFCEVSKLMMNLVKHHIRGARSVLFAPTHNLKWFTSVVGLVCCSIDVRREKSVTKVHRESSSSTIAKDSSAEKSDGTGDDSDSSSQSTKAKRVDSGQVWAHSYIHSCGFTSWK